MLPPLALAPAAGADLIELTDDTPARGIVLTNGVDYPHGVVVTAQLFNMATCQLAIADNVEETKATAKVMCVRADMSKAGSIRGDLPFLDLTKYLPHATRFQSSSQHAIKAHRHRTRRNARMIGSLELFAFMAVVCLCFVAGTLNERW